MSVKVIAFYEDTWVGPRTDIRLWDQTTRAFGVEDIQLIYDWSEAQIPDGYETVILTESGSTDVTDFNHPTNAVYIYGKSNQNIEDIVTNPDHKVKVTTPEAIPMFGCVVNGIVLQDRKAKGG